jgi:hypothetical protein
VGGKGKEAGEAGEGVEGEAHVNLGVVVEEPHPRLGFVL